MIIFFLLPAISAFCASLCDIMSGGRGTSVAAYYCFSHDGMKRGCCVGLLSCTIIVTYGVIGVGLCLFGCKFGWIVSVPVVSVVTYVFIAFFSVGVLFPFVAWRFKSENLGILWLYCFSKTKKARFRTVGYLLSVFPLILLSLFFPFPILPLLLPNIVFHVSAYAVYSLDSLCMKSNETFFNVCKKTVLPQTYGVGKYRNIW